MRALIENAKRILDVAESAADGESQDFALLIRSDGALHFVMQSEFSMEAAASYAGAQCAFRVTRNGDGVRVTGSSGGERCVVEKRNVQGHLLRDQPLYLC